MLRVSRDIASKENSIMRTSLRGRGSRSPVRPGWVQEGRGGSSGAEQLLGGTGGDSIASRDSDTWGRVIM